LDRYGCGSCGPRGFYGTIDVHLHLEEQFAEMMKTDGAILYSDGASTCSSTIAAFCKRGDLLVVDEAIYEPLQTGVQLSRANVKWFKHNDMEDLRRVMEKVHQADLQLGRKPNAQRRFIVVEGLYKNTGTICPLDEVVKLKHEFNYRLILDESFSFGTLGPTGRGCTELYGKKLMYDAEIVTVSLENTVGSIGGMTIGTDEVVDHQRLSGAGYCYSASSPPFTASAAMEALNPIQHRSGLLQWLTQNHVNLYQQLSHLLTNKLQDLLLITSDKCFPIVMLQVADNIPKTEYLDECVFLEEVVGKCLYSGVVLVAAGPTASEVNKTTNNIMTTSTMAKHTTANPPPGICMAVSTAHTKSDVDRALSLLCDAVDVIMNCFHNEESAL
jgi:serine palmitoyltransferase